MNEGSSIQVKPLGSDSIEDVLRIHRAGLGNTVNSVLGTGHLRFLYETMARQPDCFVGVACMDGRHVGVVSGSVDAGAFAAKLWRCLSLDRILKITLGLLTRPRLLRLLWQGRRIAAPVMVDEETVTAVLTAIAVDPASQHRGIGRALVRSFEAFLRNRGIRAYRLDTQSANEAALRFYRNMGFAEAAQRADSVILVRRLH